MSDLERYIDQLPVQDSVHFERPVESDNASVFKLIKPVLVYWYIVVVTFVLVCAIGIPVVWYNIKPEYSAAAAIRLAPIIPSILFRDKDSERVMPMYSNFKNDQARLITKDQRILQRVADSLANKNLKFFEAKDASSEASVDPVEILRNAINSGVLRAAPARNSELILITMKSRLEKEARIIVDAFRNAYMAVEGSRSSQGGDQKLQLLENERRIFSDKLKRQKETLRQLAQEYGSVELTPRQEMMLRRVAMLQDLVTKIESDKLLLEIKIELLGKTKDKPIMPSNLLKMRHDFINTDPRVVRLTNIIIEMEQVLIVAKQNLTPTNPRLLDKIALLESFNTNLEKRSEELGKSFDESIIDESSRSKEEQIIEAKARLEGLSARREILQAKLDAEDAKTIQIGRKQLDIQTEQEKVALTKEVYSTIRRRIQELEVESKRPARMSIPYNVTSNVVPDKKKKLTKVVIFGGMALGMLLALLRGRLDTSLHTPEDIVKRVGSRVIGTTTRLDDIERSLLPQQVADDYQTIHANLRLQDGGEIPDKVVITSAGVRDGKTTFAINLAISLARVGKRVLLIDGDLRKPDIARMLDVSKGSNGLRDVLLGKRYENVVHYVPSKGFDVLIADSETTLDAFELISLPHIGKYLGIISERYDHVIIDTPPVLAFPDALIWVKLADAVILISFAGRTGQMDLKEAYKRLNQTGTNILGTVLNSVQANYSYNRYGYGYYAQRDKDKDDHRNNKGTFLLPSE